MGALGYGYYMVLQLQANETSASELEVQQDKAESRNDSELKKENGVLEKDLKTANESLKSDKTTDTELQNKLDQAGKEIDGL